MVKIGIITPILIHDLTKHLNNTSILEYVEQIYNNFGDPLGSMPPPRLCGLKKMLFIN